MGDLISRQAAIDAVEAICNTPCNSYFADAIKRLPSADRLKGEWVPVYAYEAFGGDYITWQEHGNPIAFHYCSNCKGQSYAGEDGEELLTDFCPHCGADMRGGKHER